MRGDRGERRPRVCDKGVPAWRWLRDRWRFLRFGVPFEFASETEREVGQVAGGGDLVSAFDIGDGAVDGT